MKAGWSGRRWALAGVALAAAATGCAAPVEDSAAPAFAYLALGPQGQAVARAIVDAASCPDILVDGVALPMQARAARGTAAARGGQPAPARFDVLVCERPLAPAVREAAIGATSLPLPRAVTRRIVVLGDSGCRIKQSDHVFQDCTDPVAWPFASLAAAAAREHPDLVVHVGDYHYRESACPLALGCFGSVWGYGWEAWRADFFEPARPLLLAAPWVFVRGNHESCSRAGQGWFRLLDPAPFDARRSCDDPALDADADTTDPYAVPLGGDWQLLVFDSSRASRPLSPTQSPEAAVLDRYRAQVASLGALTRDGAGHSLFTSHHPILAYAPGFPAGLGFGNPDLVAALRAAYGPGLFPAGVMAALHGHIHTFEAINFRSDHPATLVSGQGGDSLDSDLPDQLPADLPAPPVAVDFVAHAKRFGYLVLDRRVQGWAVRAVAVDGAVLAECSLEGRHLACPVHAGWSLPAARVESAAPTR